MQIVQELKMNFTSIHFLLFLPLAAAVYFLVPKKGRRIWLLLCSYYFYFFSAAEYLIILITGTLYSYFLTRLIAFSKTRKGRNAALLFGILGQAGILIFFKYNAFFASFLKPFFAGLGIEYNSDYFISAKVFGLSFYTFTAIGYMVDVWSKTVEADKSLISHALFLGFFPVTRSGPISRAGDLMPQLNDVSRKFNPKESACALKLMAIGFFKKLCVADTLAIFVNSVFGSGDTLAQSYGFTMIAGAFAFIFQLYFDFSGYSDIAVATARILGIKIVNNFNTPFFSTNFSGLWSRWHISLSSWLQDYIFTPLAWSRWTEKLPFIGKKVKNPPVLSSILVVFTVSGIWHGDSMCYLVWGFIQAFFRIGEELLHRILGKPKKKTPRIKRAGKIALVFLLWTQSHIIFRVGIAGGTVAEAFNAFINQFRFGGAGGFAAFKTNLYNAVYYGVYTKSLIVYGFIIFSVICLAAALFVDWYRFAKMKGKPTEEIFTLVKPKVKWLMYIGIVLACLCAFILQSGGYGGTNFIYGGF